MHELEKYTSRLGEPAINALLDRWEHKEGIRHNEPLPLEQRWMLFMERTSSHLQCAAA